MNDSPPAPKPPILSSGGNHDASVPETRALEVARSGFGSAFNTSKEIL